MRLLFFFTILLITQLVLAQEKIDFENFGLTPNDFLNGSDLNGGFNAGGVFLPNGYDETYGSWEGWSISTVQDGMTSGFSNQYASIAGAGNEASITYATASAFGNVGLQLNDFSQGAIVKGMYLTNSTYAHNSMRDGDAFGKKFGGITGDDPDYFYITIKGFFEGVEKEEYVIFHLADFRADENELDYIINDWTFVDLSSLGQVDRLEFALSSSDTGAFGINTPAYFCMDDITLDLSTSTNDIDQNVIKVFPNPTAGDIYIETNSESNKSLRIFNDQGQLINEVKFTDKIKHISLENYPIGNYTIRLYEEGIVYSSNFVRI